MDERSQVAITGGTGFIGGRLVERLVLERNVHPKCLVRSYSHCASLSRLKVELVQVELPDAGGVKTAIRECDYVIHTAYSWDGDHGARQANLRGTMNLYRAASECGCRRFIHISTDAIYGFNKPPTIIDETFPLSSDQHPYIAIKVELERRLTRLSLKRGSAPLTIIRPAIVFGPGHNTWTTQVVADIQNGRQFLVENGSGVCNSLYVDNLVDVVLAACEHNEAAGQTFLVTDGSPITWKAYVDAFSKLCGVKSSNMPNITMADAARLRERLPVAMPNLGSALTSRPVRAQLLSVPWISDLWMASQRWLPRQGTSAESKGATPSLMLPDSYDPFRAFVYANQTTYSVQKARSLLGYSPRIDFDEAMRRTAAWLLFARLIE